MYDIIDLNIKMNVISEWVMLNIISFTRCLLELGELQLIIYHISWQTLFLFQI